jgi:hypothetical protein
MNVESLSPPLIHGETSRDCSAGARRKRFESVRFFMPRASKDQRLKERERAKRLGEHARSVLEKARNTAQVSVFRREVARLERKKKNSD